MQALPARVRIRASGGQRWRGWLRTGLGCRPPCPRWGLQAAQGRGTRRLSPLPGSNFSNLFNTDILTCVSVLCLCCLALCPTFVCTHLVCLRLVSAKLKLAWQLLDTSLEQVLGHQSRAPELTPQSSHTLFKCSLCCFAVSVPMSGTAPGPLKAAAAKQSWMLSAAHAHLAGAYRIRSLHRQL